MPSMALISFLVIFILALTFEFINGFHDTANSIATSVSTRVLTPKAAIIMAAGLNLFGALWGALGSGAVAKTISGGLVHGQVAMYVLGAALVAAILWNLVTWYIGIPSSSTHAIIGAIIGASIGDALSTQTIIWGGLIKKVIIPLLTSPLIGFVVGYLFMTLLFELLRRFSQAVVNKWFSKLQILSAAMVAFTHGSNDAQKTIGVVMMAVVSINSSNPGQLPNFFLPANGHAAAPVWIVLVCAMIMMIGTSVGGWRIIKTMGMNMIKMQPIGGFAAQTGAALVIETLTQVGAPVSTTHVISSAIVGVGASKRIRSVRWSVVRDMVASWFLTIPITMIIGGILVVVFKLIFM